MMVALDDHFGLAHPNAATPVEHSRLDPRIAQCSAISTQPLGSVVVAGGSLDYRDPLVAQRDQVAIIVGQPDLTQPVPVRVTVPVHVSVRDSGPASVPVPGGNAADAVARLKDAYARWRQHTGPLYPSPLFGLLPREMITRGHLVHAAHHLSFLVPRTG